MTTDDEVTSKSALVNMRLPSGSVLPQKLNSHELKQVKSKIDCFETMLGTGKLVLIFFIPF